jgi:hypothetical protein
VVCADEKSDETERTGRVKIFAIMKPRRMELPFFRFDGESSADIHHEPDLYSFPKGTRTLSISTEAKSILVV